MPVLLPQTRLRPRRTCGTLAAYLGLAWFLALAAFVVALLSLGQPLPATLGAAVAVTAVSSRRHPLTTNSAIRRTLEAALTSSAGVQR